MRNSRKRALPATAMLAVLAAIGDPAHAADSVPLGGVLEAAGPSELSLVTPDGQSHLLFLDEELLEGREPGALALLAGAMVQLRGLPTTLPGSRPPQGQAYTLADPVVRVEGTLEVRNVVEYWLSWGSGSIPLRSSFIGLGVEAADAGKRVAFTGVVAGRNPERRHGWFIVYGAEILEPSGPDAPGSNVSRGEGRGPGWKDAAGSGGAGQTR